MLEIAEIKMAKKTNYCLNFSLVFPIIRIPILISVVMIQRMQEGNKSFTVRPAAYVTVDFKKLASDRFHAGSTLVESECIKRKTRLSE